MCIMLLEGQFFLRLKEKDYTLGSLCKCFALVQKLPSCTTMFKHLKVVASHQAAGNTKSICCMHKAKSFICQGVFHLKHISEQNEIRKIVHFRSESGGPHHFTDKIVFLMEHRDPRAHCPLPPKELLFALCKCLATVRRRTRAPFGH